MKRFVAIGLLALAAACHPSSRGPLTGAPTPRTAVEQFLGAVRAQDLQAMSTVWGTSKGPARDQMQRDQLEKRELLMMCYLTHDRYQVLGEVPTETSHRTLRVELTRGTTSRVTTFITVPGPSDRWYVESADLKPVEDLCRNRPQGS